MSYSKALNVIRDIHKHGVMHGDISTANVVLADIDSSNHDTIYHQGQVYLVDFGASRKMGGTWREVCRRVVHLHVFLSPREELLCSGGLCVSCLLLLSLASWCLHNSPTGQIRVHDKYGLLCTEAKGLLTRLFCLFVFVPA